MNGSCAPGMYNGEGSGSDFILTPTDVRSALQYTALASLTPASAVIGTLPPLSVAFRDYTTCSLSDPQYAPIAAMVEHQNSSQIDIGLQQQLQAVRGLLNQVDVSYVRFKTPSTSIPPFLFDYPNTPLQQFIPQKRPFNQAMDLGQNPRSNAVPSPTIYHPHHNFYPAPTMIPVSQSISQASVPVPSPPPSRQQGAYHRRDQEDLMQRFTHEMMISTGYQETGQWNINSDPVDYDGKTPIRHRQRDFDTPPMSGSNDQSLISSPKLQTVAPHETILYPSNIQIKNSVPPILQNSYLPSSEKTVEYHDLKPPSPKNILKNQTIDLASSKSAPLSSIAPQTQCSKDSYQDLRMVSPQPQNVVTKVTDLRSASPRVVIETTQISPNKIYQDDSDSSSNEKSDISQSLSWKEKRRRSSPEVVVEMPSREILNEYRSPRLINSEWGASPNYVKRRSSYDSKKQKEKDQDNEREGESALNKLVNFISTIFEAEDSISPDDAPRSNLSSLFTYSTIGSNEPLLSTNAIKQLVKLVNKVGRYRKLEDAEVEDLMRILKILERSVREVESLDILPNSSGQNSKGDVDRSGTLTPRYGNKNTELMNVDNIGFEEVDNMDNETKIQQVELKIEIIVNGIEAAICALSIMTGGKLSKQLYPEDLIVSSLNLAKNQLNGIVYKLLEMNPNNDDLSNENDLMIWEIVKKYPLLYDLMQQEELSDSVVITVGFISVGPFFVDSMNSSAMYILGNGGLEGVKLVALGLLRSIFTNHQKQRTWILEEILTSLIKLPTAKRNLRQYRLPDGKSIQMVSALILQLIQSCTAGLNEHRPRSTEDGTEEISVSDSIKGDIPDDVFKVGHAWKKGIDAASANAHYVFKFLLARCTKLIKNSNESDYRLLLDNFMEDIITVLNYPEWPAAELVVRIFSKIMVGYIDDKKADTYTKSMAIDYLGTIAGRIKKYVNSGLPAENLEEGQDEKDTRDLVDKIKDIPKGEITGHSRIPTVTNLWNCQKKVLDFLELGAFQDPGLQSARHFYLSEWGYSFANALVSMDQDPMTLGSRQQKNKLDERFTEVKNLLEHIVQEYWIMSTEDGGKQTLEYRYQIPERSEILLVAELLASRQALYQSFDLILSRILASLDMSVVAFRTKALRALGQVVVCDPSILSQVNVRNTIAQRLQDNSPAVRDAAIDLVGRYLAQKPEITEQYYKVISDRVLDTGLNVRKRVIKLLRDIYLKSSDQTIMIDIGCKILLRINDDDDHVKELALKTIQELWLTPFSYQRNVTIEIEDLDEDDEGQSEFLNMSQTGKKEVLTRSLLIVGVSSKLGERNGYILGGLFKKILEKENKQKREILNICQCIVDCLFEHLLTLQDANSKTEVVSCISTICLLSNASPSLVKRHVLTLQPYLKGASTSEDQAIMYYVLLIYRSVLPLIKRPNPAFLAEVEAALLSLLAKSPQKILREVVPCLCIIADKLTHNYVLLIKLLRSCLDKLKLERKSFESSQNLSSARNVMVLLLIIGLLCQNFDFDKKRLENPGEMKELNTIDKGMIIPLVFDLVMYFCKETLSETVQKMALQGLGFIYLSYPIMMLRLESTDLMDRILSNGAMDMKIQLIKVFLDFLLAEQQKINADLEDKKTKSNTPVDLKVLIGNAEEFAEAGVSSSLMQRYLERILNCTFDQNQHLKIVALDVLGNIIQQGLAHPVLCMPTIVALETSPESALRDKAFKLHQHLNEKHASLIHSRHVECVRKAYSFQKQLVGNNAIVGYATRSPEGQPEALLNPMYSLLKEKRQRRNDFLVSVVRTFDFDLKKCDESKVDVDFCRFVAENLATIDYKTIEEVLQVIYCINRLLSIVAISVLHSLQDGPKISLGVDAKLNIKNEIFADNVRIIIDNTFNPEITKSAIPSDLFMDIDRLTENSDYASPMATEDVLAPQLSEEIDDQGSQQGTKSRHIETENTLPRAFAAKVSICMAILMYLKEHLKKVYALSEAKCQNFNPAQSGSHKDKPALRHQNAPSTISWEILPFVQHPMLTEDDVTQQCELFKKLMAEDGTQHDEFGETDLETAEELNHKAPNGYNDDFDYSTSSTLDTISTRATNTNPLRKGVVRKLVSSSKAKSTSKTGARKRNIGNESRSKKTSKKKRKSAIGISDSEDEDSDFQL
ncbi:hypothetical protein G9A89_023899 [Geosiphon pyriformis]|nr:hypothetical protein G9A89_023899 [Geosiphon pyriformis]